MALQLLSAYVMLHWLSHYYKSRHVLATAPACLYERTISGGSAGWISALARLCLDWQQISCRLYVLLQCTRRVLHLRVIKCRIVDPSAVKPANWDDRRYITDPHAVKPEGWLDDEPTEVPDPTATKPITWDDWKDGVWVPPPVPNPVCVGAVGCGPWKAPTVPNPRYKGPWLPPQIKNPQYKVRRHGSLARLAAWCCISLVLCNLWYGMVISTR